ncbi:hypothetical protein EMIHUDRAFT_226185 [Emiliania huxleyi CCMP1516]|uniref:TIR domain-containing protein n=2 Tax=Emiliania huxleyi TaxID=2903 RepID=A0A0D3KLM7_EMIH1|nr:hypothetical protein EMIHUDRAFT_226185 [Emiliania huxleyi CCMP1516]EOD36662.1 hypothetical protein EMIHUDRAFT_226185 [Emiliania huxleyi CCMP1516]|eukprot:XP_005789091.1 hypothetical protein EMIHUDRAFT_226185 [Emiliania huxleyi CCMP1516]
MPTPQIPSCPSWDCSVLGQVCTEGSGYTCCAAANVPEDCSGMCWFDNSGLPSGEVCSASPCSNHCQLNTTIIIVMSVLGLLIAIAGILVCFYIARRRRRLRQVAPPGSAVSQRKGSACDVFGSYKQNDGTDGLLFNLFYTLEMKGIDLWLDKKRGSERSEAGMRAGVRACKLFCAVISPKYFESAFCLLELRTALSHKKPIVVCFNSSKFTVQQAMSWIPEEFRGRLLSNEVVALHEDDEYMRVGVEKVAAQLSLSSPEQSLS